MPKILDINGFKFYFFSHEPNEPAHIHVDKAGNTAKFWLSPIELARNIGFTARELKEIRLLIETHHEKLTEAWHGYFGTKRG